MLLFWTNTDLDREEYWEDESEEQSEEESEELEV